MDLERVKIMKENALQSCTTIDTMRDFTVRACDDLIKSQDHLGKTAYVTINRNYFYKAKVLGYGAYGDNQDYNTYCVLVQADKERPFVDYFKEIHTEQEYLKWKNKYEEYPFGYCHKCGEEFNSELVEEYNIRHCPWCGESVSKQN